MENMGVGGGGSGSGTKHLGHDTTSIRPVGFWYSLCAFPTARNAIGFSNLPRSAPSSCKPSLAILPGIRQSSWVWPSWLHAVTHRPSLLPWHPRRLWLTAMSLTQSWVGVCLPALSLRSCRRQGGICKAWSAACNHTYRACRCKVVDVVPPTPTHIFFLLILRHLVISCLPCQPLAK